MRNAKLCELIVGFMNGFGAKIPFEMEDFYSHVPPKPDLPPQPMSVMQESLAIVNQAFNPQ